MDVKETNRIFKSGFNAGCAAERERIVHYLIDKRVIRRDAFGDLVKETDGIDVPYLEEIEANFEASPTYTPTDYVWLSKKEIGALVERMQLNKDVLVRDRLLELRKLAPAGSEVSIAITKWVREID